MALSQDSATMTAIAQIAATTTDNSAGGSRMAHNLVFIVTQTVFAEAPNTLLTLLMQGCQRRTPLADCPPTAGPCCPAMTGKHVSKPHVFKLDPLGAIAFFGWDLPHRDPTQASHAWTIL